MPAFHRVAASTKPRPGGEQSFAWSRAAGYELQGRAAPMIRSLEQVTKINLRPRLKAGAFSLGVLASHNQTGGFLRPRSDVSGETYVLVLAAQFARVLNHVSPSKIGGRREGRVAAAPGAPAQRRIARARKPQVQAVTTGLPCAVVYGLLRTLPGEPAVCHRRLREAFQLCQDLAPAWARQDHTSLFPYSDEHR
jgi:hypothetical protein